MSLDDMPAGRRWRFLPCAAVATLGLSAGLLYLVLPFPVYRAIVHLWGFQVWPFPFLDTDTVLSAVRCLRKGVDVFAANPCDPLQRVFDYSPLWLVLAALPFTESWTAPSGMIVDIAFVLSLLLLPAARDRKGALLITLGAIASAPLFALERGNNDLVLFVLAALAATAMLHSPLVRALGYGCALLAGLLKYYPMALMALALRERPRFFVAVLLVSCAAVALFLAVMGHDLLRALRLIPTGDWFFDMFGSSTLPGGLAELFGWSPAVTLALRLALSIVALTGGILIARDGAFIAAVGGLAERQRLFLLVGALLVLGCFFSAQNIGYRAVHILLALPALLALREAAPAARPWRVAPWFALACLWSIGWRHWLEQLQPANHRQFLIVSGWMLREAAWWGLVTILIGAVVAILWRTRMARLVLRTGAPAHG